MSVRSVRLQTCAYSFRAKGDTQTPPYLSPELTWSQLRRTIVLSFSPDPRRQGTSGGHLAGLPAFGFPNPDLDQASICDLRLQQGRPYNWGSPEPPDRI